MNLQNQLIEFAELHGLKEKALSAVENELDACIASDKEIGLDFMEGHERDELIYKFGSYNLETNHLDHCHVITRINIYTKNLYGPNFDVPIGYYREVTDMEGNHMDEYLNPNAALDFYCLLYTSPSPRDQRGSRMPSSA